MVDGRLPCRQLSDPRFSPFDSVPLLISFFEFLQLNEGFKNAQNIEIGQMDNNDHKKELGDQDDAQEYTTF